MLGKAAEFYEDEVDEAVKGLSSLMEPFIIVILAPSSAASWCRCTCRSSSWARWSDQPARRWTRSPCRALHAPGAGAVRAVHRQLLNVVIHRWPLMLEREWRAESLPAAGVAIEPGRTAHAVASGLALPVLRPPHPLAREHPGASAGAPARALLGLQDADLAALPARRGVHRHRSRPSAGAFRRDAARAAVVHGRHADRAGAASTGTRPSCPTT